MPWDDKHLHEFRFPSGDTAARIGIPGFVEFAEDVDVASWETRLKNWFFAAADRCSYVYDFGDHWVHTVTLESRRPAEARGRYPRCTGGERRAPPEDVGGAHGYAEFLAAVSNPLHREHRMFLEWVGGPWDPEKFRCEDVAFSAPSKRLRMAGLG